MDVLKKENNTARLGRAPPNTCTSPHSYPHCDMLSAILSIVGVASVGAALIWTFNRQMGAVLHQLTKVEPSDIPAEAYDDEWIHRALERLTAAVAEGIDNVERNEKRVRGIIRGAQRRFENSEYYDAGVEAEADTLPEDHEETFREQRMQPVPEDMEQPHPNEAWSVIPGRVG
jgi:hypothetical protein